MRSSAKKNATGTTTGFEFPDRIPINEAATLDQLTSRFVGVRDGLPELIKNAKDQYSRLGVTESAKRQIVVIANTSSKTLGVLDFAGAPRRNFEGWTKWSDPNAGQTDIADDIEAGHGNGGKSFMVRGAMKRAFLESCFDGKRTKKGFQNNKERHRYKPGFAVEKGDLIDDVAEENVRARLGEALRLMELDIENLPTASQEVFEERGAYTLAFLDKVVDWSRRRPGTLAQWLPDFIYEIISTHGQTAMSVETCEVWVLVDGVIVTSEPVKSAEIAPYAGFEEPRRFEIPDILTDPETGDGVSTSVEGADPGYLILQTSDRQLQIAKLAAKNVIRVWNARNNVATWPLNSLHSVSAASYILGELRCPALVGEHLSGADRQHLSDTPLVRALAAWTSEKVEALTDDLHSAMAARSNPKDRNKAKRALSGIRELMRQFLDPDQRGAIGSDNSGGQNSKDDDGPGNDNTRNRQKFGERVDEVILEHGKSEIFLMQGTGVPILYNCLQHNPDGSSLPVKSDVSLKCEPKDQFRLDSSNILTADTPGQGRIWLETSNGAVSNVLEVWAFEASDVSADLPSEALRQGEKRNLKFVFETTEGPVDGALLEAHVMNSDFGSIGRLGRFQAGLKEGEAVVRVGFGKGHHRDFIIEIGSERMPPPENSSDGSDVPEILFCGEEAPGSEEYHVNGRTIIGGPELPTIIEDPKFPNVVWINDSSKEAVRVRRSGGGSSGIGKVASKTFMHFVALKCFDILKRLYVRQEISGSLVTEYQYMQAAVEAEIECADFIDEAWDLSDQLLTRNA